MLQDNNCCGFFIKLCRKICVKGNRESVKPDIDVAVFNANRTQIRDAFRERALKNQKAYKSSIYKPGSQNSIKNPSLGFVRTADKAETIEKEVKLEENCQKDLKKKVNKDEISENTVYTEQLPNEIMMNMDEAYKIIIDSESPSLESQVDYSQKFSKVVIGMDFKKILEEGPEDSC
jgi:hypothetical protein